MGLTYAQKHRFRSEVLIDVDPPIDVASHLPPEGQDEFVLTPAEVELN